MLIYKTTHYSRVIETEIRLTLWQRLRVALGLPVECFCDCNYAATHETPLTSKSLDVRSRVKISA
jgi:hypothetical protein